MGIFDWLRRMFSPPGPTPTGPSPSPASASPPNLALPSRARISTFDVADAVGTLELSEGGAPVRFGRSACQDFEPLVGAEVLITEAERQAPGGWRARALSLAPGHADAYEALLAARDASRGLPSPSSVAPSAARDASPSLPNTHTVGPFAARDASLGIPSPYSVEQTTAIANALAYASVLMTAPVPTSPGALAAWLEHLGVARHGFVVKVERGVRLTWGRHDLHVEPGPGPFPREYLDLRLAADLPEEAGFLSLTHGLPSRNVDDRRMLGDDAPDPWAEDGLLRVMSRLAALLVREGTAVVMHRAGSMVLDRETFLRLLGDLDHPDCRPFAAWTDIARVDEGRRVRTFGMDVFGLPDVELAPEGRGSWYDDRAHEALMLASYRMVRENRELRDGERLDVPVGLRLGAWPASIEGDAERYRVRAGPSPLVLLEREPGSLDAFGRWARASVPGAFGPASQLGANTYQALFQYSLQRVLPGDAVAELVPPERPEFPPHQVLVRTRDDDAGYLLVTNGFGRLAQKGGSPDAGNTHVELAAWVDSHNPQRASALSTLGLLMHVHPGDTEAWKAGDTIVLPEPLVGLRHFVLARGPTVPIPPGTPVRLMWVIPVSAGEYAEVRGGGGAWAERQLADRESFPGLRRRWNLGMN